MVIPSVTVALQDALNVRDIAFQISDQLGYERMAGGRAGTAVHANHASAAHTGSARLAQQSDGQHAHALAPCGVAKFRVRRAPRNDLRSNSTHSAVDPMVKSDVLTCITPVGAKLMHGQSCAA